VTQGDCGSGGPSTRFASSANSRPGRSASSLPGPARPRPARWLRTCPVQVAAAIYALSAIIFCAVLATGRAGFVDLQVYRMAGSGVLHQLSLYSLRVHGMPFTYPPFAAISFAGAAAVPMAVAAAVLTAAGLVALPVLLYLALRLPPLTGFLGAQAAWRLAFIAAAGAVWLEPVQSTLAYGQVNLLLAAAVLYDLNLPAGSRWKGVGIGLAAGLKLTPAIFAIYYLITRRYRAAATSAAAFAASVALGFAILPASSQRYWAGEFVSSSRVGQLYVGANESLAGALARTLHTTHVTWIWLPLALAVIVTGLALAARAQRRGSEAAGFSLCAITGLLISPVSWTHHWVMAVPALLIAAVAAARAWPRSQVKASAWLTGVVLLTVIGWTRLARVVGGDHWLHLSQASILLTELYVIAALAALVMAAWPTARSPGAARPDSLRADRSERLARVSSER
jgi:alpha-1,2-mannosyltransferase